MALGPDLTNRAHMVVTKQTSLHQLKEFTDSLGEGTSVRAFTNQDGHTVLYAKTTKVTERSFLEKLFGPARRRENRARSEIKNFIRQHHKELLKSGKLQEQDNESRILTLTTGHRALQRNGTLEDDPVVANDVRTLIDTAFALYHGKTGDSGKTVSEKLGKQLDGNARPIARELVQGVKDGKSIETLAKDLAPKLENALQKYLSKSNRTDFVLHELPQMRRDLLAAAKGESADSDEHLVCEQVLEQGLERLASSLLEVPTSSSIESISVGKKTYQLGEVIASGSFGTVAKFVDTSDGKPIAVKVTKGGVPTNEKKGADLFASRGDYSTTNMVEEFLRHKEIQGPRSHENILQVKDLFRLESGQVGITMEIAPHGTLFDYGQKLAKGRNEHGFSQELHSSLVLRAFKDMASGLQDIQARGFVHGDFKTPNVFIGEGGKMKIADFGTAQGGNRLKLVDGVKVDNPVYLAPEVVRGFEGISDLDKQQKNEVQLIKEKFDNDFLRVFSDSMSESNARNCVSILESSVTGFLMDYTKDGYQPSKESKSVGVKSDTWALGTCLYELMTGRQFTTGEFNFQHEQRLTSFRDGVAIGPNGHFDLPSTGNEAIDRLINQMLHPDPEKRPSMNEILRNDLLTDRKLDEPVLRDMTVAIASSDPNVYFSEFVPSLDRDIRRNLGEASDIAGEFLRQFDDN